MGNEASEPGLPTDALTALRQCAALVLEMRPSEPQKWAQLAKQVLAVLGTTRDLRDFHLPLLEQLVEHRELAWSSPHARLFLELQNHLASKVWAMLRSLTDSESELLDRGTVTLVSVLQSPDLARFITAQATSDGSLAEFARLKAAVIESEQLLEMLQRQTGTGVGGSGIRVAAKAALTAQEWASGRVALESQVIEAQKLREAFLRERGRLADIDPRFASAFKLPTVESIRAALRHGRGSALLCLLELPAEEAQGDTRAVAALLHADGRRTQLLELPELSDLAWAAGFHQPDPRGDRHRGPLRGDFSSARGNDAAMGRNPPVCDEIQRLMTERLWRPLSQARVRVAGDGAAGAPVERVHICPHGTLHQLPLALTGAGGGNDLQPIVWPGLPYLRLAAATADAVAAVPQSPWLVGHDGAWASSKPLPMVAVEAALLCRMLRDHGQAVQRIEHAAQVQGVPAGLVTCCHGRSEAKGSHFDGALHLGSAPLKVRQIIAQRLGPALALLPACHAGETVESEAGNALGVAAAFLLGGTRVALASSKAVPDMLMPWLSTLMLWHLLHENGLPGHEAAQLARQQFAGLAFPEDYRAWLQGALPQALATIQPGGEEDRLIRGPFAAQATATVARCWPWQGDTVDLFASNRGRRRAATRSVAQGVLMPREDNAAELAVSVREMAAFVFVYGAG